MATLQDMLVEDGTFLRMPNIVEADVELPAHPQRLLYVDLRGDGQAPVRVVMQFNAGGTAIEQIHLLPRDELCA